MNGRFSRGISLHGAGCPQLPVADHGGQGGEEILRPLAKGAEEREAVFLQPRQCHWTRYKCVVRALHTKILVAGTLMTSASILALSWKAAGGEFISLGRWLLGFGSGLFLAGMLRLALFVFLAGPQSFRLNRGRVRLSGLGVVKAADVLEWTLQPVHARKHRKPWVRLTMRCRWHGWERDWSMDLEAGPQAAQLERLLAAACPRAGATAERVVKTGQLDLPLSAGYGPAPVRLRM